VSGLHHKTPLSRNAWSKQRHQHLIHVQPLALGFIYSGSEIL